jgi:hypothetical protein
MSHFAEVINGIVHRVIVAEQDFIDSGKVGDPSTWIQCSYNTCGGVHIHGEEPLRKNFPGPGYMYDAERDAFIPPKEYASWTLNEDTCLWEAPMPLPADDRAKYKWSETNQRWIANVN